MSEKRTGDERSRSKSSRRTGSRSAKRSKPRPPRAEKDSSAPAAEDLGRDRDPEKRPPDPFENYQYPNDRGFLRILLLLLELLGVVLLFVLCFAPPNLASGSVSVLRDTAGEEFVGVLRKCSASTCDPWLGGSTDASSASSDSLDFPTMYLTTGLATLSAFWILLYLLIFTFIRFAFFGVPPSIESSGKRQAWKRFAYRATRVWLVVLCILIGAILLDVIVKGSQYRSLEKLSGIDGVGPGIAMVLFAWLSCVVCTIIELGGERTHRFFNAASCGMDWGCCGVFESRAMNKDEGGIEMEERGRSAERKTR